MKSIFIILVIFATSCIQDNKLISSNKIGNYELGDKLPESFNTNIFDLTSNKNNIIISIIVKSDEYKTKEGLGVGSDLSEIQSAHEDAKKEPFTLSKGNNPIGDLGVKIVHDKISFIDSNKDNKVDFVWIQFDKKSN